MTTREPAQEILQSLALFKSRAGKLFALTLAYFLVTFGQPAFFGQVAPIAAIAGFSLLFIQTAHLERMQRFLAGFGFFFLVQAVQLWWFTSHPFSYIWAVYFTLCTLMGVQFGLLNIAASKKTLQSALGPLFIASLWTLLEWSRIYWLSGFYFDLVGQYLSANTLSLQMGSLFGMVGLSFWVMLTNCYVASCWLKKSKITGWVVALLIAAVPYLYGSWQLATHEEAKKAYDAANPPIKTLIAHSKKVPDEIDPQATGSPLQRAFDRWQEIIIALSPYKGEMHDMILLPEVVVPFTSSSLIYPKELVRGLFRDYLKTDFTCAEEEYVCSEDIAKALSSAFGCPVIIGLEGTQMASRFERQKFFNSAFCFTGVNLPHLRYDKQILVPMGEYIPFLWAKELAAPYGIFDSFTPGTQAKLFYIGPHRVGPSICYEETFSNLMRQNSKAGATLLVNVTDDYWFPYSKLGKQHFEHARARTVENGTPLLRSCNFGISGAVDSLGRTVVAVEGTPDLQVMPVSLSSYHYSTLYTNWGDMPVLFLTSLICIIFAGRYLFTKIRR